MLSCESILRKVVNESMHEILEEWLESGNLVRYRSHRANET